VSKTVDTTADDPKGSKQSTREMKLRQGVDMTLEEFVMKLMSEKRKTWQRCKATEVVGERLGDRGGDC